MAGEHAEGELKEAPGDELTLGEELEPGGQAPEELELAQLLSLHQEPQLDSAQLGKCWTHAHAGACSEHKSIRPWQHISHNSKPNMQTNT